MTRPRGLDRGSFSIMNIDDALNTRSEQFSRTSDTLKTPSDAEENCGSELTPVYFLALSKKVWFNTAFFIPLNYFSMGIERRYVFFFLH